MVEEYEQISSSRRKPSVFRITARYCLTMHGYSCWDGKNLDSPDHKVDLTVHAFLNLTSKLQSHMAFAEGPVNPNLGIIAHNGTCPASHPVRVPTILYETYWNTTVFKDMWPADGSQPFVLSMGDP